MHYYYKSKKGNKVLCLDHPISEDPRYKHSAHLFEAATLGEYENYVAAKNAKIEIAHLEKELAATDWVIVKIAEETDPSEIAALRTKYGEIILARKVKRARINELETLL